MEQRDVLSPGAAGGHNLTADQLAHRLRHGLSDAARGDLLLEQHVDGLAQPPRPLHDRPLTPAAVLVPVVQRQDGLTVMFTQRTAHLAHHPGQISFPGGRLEDEDHGDPIHAALRETEEEVGLARQHVTIIGRLDDYHTGTGFLVTPVVGMVQPPFDVTPDPFEVAEIFEVPLPHLLHRDHYQLHRRVVEGRSRPFWSITWDQRFIWGATAGMLVNLCDVLAARS